MSDLTYRISAKILYAEGAEGALADDIPDVIASTVAKGLIAMAARIDLREQRLLADPSIEPIELVFISVAVEP